MNKESANSELSIELGKLPIFTCISIDGYETSKFPISLPCKCTTVDQIASFAKSILFLLDK